jgi:hypothetical protein
VDRGAFLSYHLPQMVTRTNPTEPPPEAPVTWADSFLPAADRVLYPLCLATTAVVWGFQLYEFWQGGAFRPRFPFAEGYLAVVGAYGAQREASKWLGVQATGNQRRRGELFVGLWVATWLALTAVGNLQPRFAMPGELMSTMLGVLGIFAVTSISSGLRSRSARARPDLRQAILGLLAQHDSISAQDAATSLNVSRPGAWKQLEALVKDGLAVQQASANSRERRYALKKKSPATVNR